MSVQAVFDQLDPAAVTVACVAGAHAAENFAVPTDDSCVVVETRVAHKFGRDSRPLIARKVTGAQNRCCTLYWLGMNSSLDLQLGRWCVASALALSAWLAAVPAPALDVPVFLGDVGVGKQTPEVRTELRSLLSAELSATDFAHVKTQQRFVLSTTLVRLDSVVASDSVRATCVISVALLRDHGATLHAVIKGRATAEESGTHAELAQSDALRAAVHSAMTRVPQALR